MPISFTNPPNEPAHTMPDAQPDHQAHQACFRLITAANGTTQHTPLAFCCVTLFRNTTDCNDKAQTCLCVCLYTPGCPSLHVANPSTTAAVVSPYIAGKWNITTHPYPYVTLGHSVLLQLGLTDGSHTGHCLAASTTNPFYDSQLLHHTVPNGRSYSFTLPRPNYTHIG